MYPGTHAKTQPDKPAVVIAETGQSLSYRQLNEDSVRIANLLRQCGLNEGDHISLFMENRLEFFTITWAALRSGLQITAVNRHLTAPEAAYIVGDSGGQVLLCSAALIDKVPDLAGLCTGCRHFFSVGGAPAGWRSLEEEMQAQPTEPGYPEMLGEAMLYSSGTTGQPKGVKRPLTGQEASAGPLFAPVVSLLGMGGDSVYLSPAPIYHAAPFHYSNGIIAHGGTVVMMEKFDALEALRTIERYRVTHSQWVPTMFVRMLKLPEQDRLRWDLSSQVMAIHAAAPCPIEVKRRMIEWWGRILLEYYAGSEGNGITVIGSDDWLEHPGSVGKALQGILHICDEDGTELKPGETGLVYFEQEGDVPSFEYHGDKEKLRSAQHPQHLNWTTLGDVGYLDEEGYLYLTDRKAYTIISGGVNIYPQEIEDVLILHDKVADVAVFGVPNEDFGEEVKAVVQLEPGVEPGEEVALELIEYARGSLAPYKVPRSVDFEEQLPRLPTGKLYKRFLRDRYRSATA